MFLPEKREVKAIKYEYGILETFDPRLAKKIAQFLIKRELPTIVQDLKREVLSRLDKCETTIEKVRLLEMKLATMKESIFPPFMHYPHDQTGAEYGFATEVKKENWTFEGFERKHMKSSIDYNNYFIDALNGAALSKFSLFVQEKIDALNQSSKIEITKDEEQIEPIQFDHNSPRHKLILLHELGILKPLRHQYSHLNIAQLAKLIALVTGISDPKKITTLSKEIDAVINNTKTKNTKGGNPINKESVKAVKRALSEIGISVKNLPHFEE